MACLTALCELHNQTSLQINAQADGSPAAISTASARSCTRAQRILTSLSPGRTKGSGATGRPQQPEEKGLVRRTGPECPPASGRDAPRRWSTSAIAVERRSPRLLAAVQAGLRRWPHPSGQGNATRGLCPLLQEVAFQSYTWPSWFPGRAFPTVLGASTTSILHGLNADCKRSRSVAYQGPDGIMPR